MEAVDLAVQFGGVFIGAFLAIGLENYRQARHTRTWVREHLRQFADWMRPALGGDRTNDNLKRQFAAIDQWLSARSPEDMDDAAWDLVATRFNSLPLDFGHLLRGEALTALQRELGSAITGVEQNALMLAKDMERVSSCQERDILPMIYRRVVPLDEVEARMVRDYRALLDDLSTTWGKLLAAAYETLDQIDRL